MKHILILGAGRSSSNLIKYLVEQVVNSDWTLTVGDYHKKNAETNIIVHDRIHAIQFDVFDEVQKEKAIADSDLVISMLPASYHIHVAKACLVFGKHLLTASYVSEEIKALDQQAKAKGLLFLMECGLDPGIDHMSALKVMHNYQDQGYKLVKFETFTGGLLSPESEGSNPWKYKFTWNPRNVVLAGQGTVKFVQEDRTKFIPYHRLFRRTELIEIPKHGMFEGYANRDSLKYQELYRLQDIKTLYRGTLRRPGFCKAWDIFVQLGATDDSYQMENVKEMTHRQFINSFLSYDEHNTVELKLAHYLNLDLEGGEMYKIKWLGLFDEDLVGIEKGSPAQILEHILKKKWTIQPSDKDMIVMWHKFDFEKGSENQSVDAYLVVIGEDDQYTAMSKTVGLPLGIAAVKFLEGEIKSHGVQIPIIPEIYNPILLELETQGIKVMETSKRT